MNTQEKSLALANIMRWGVFKITKGADWHYMKVLDKGTVILEPYENSQDGLAQFAAILLKFPEVMEEFVCTASHTDERSTTPDRYKRYGGDYQGYLTTDRPVTQESLLNVVLKMKGVIE